LDSEEDELDSWLGSEQDTQHSSKYVKLIR